ncbi:MAG: Calx-beta domain-containing protein [Verrucomicrobiota bacterium]
MKRLVTILVLLAAFTPLRAATYYIDWATGSDSNSGTSTSSPWKRAPGMNGFAGSYRHTAGDRFIFKGGVTWPVAAFQMHIMAGGTTESARDYYGVDQNWYAGGSWSRPIFDFQDTPISIGWQYAAGILIEQASYITIDNLELKRHRGFPAGQDHGATAITLFRDCAYVTIQNCFVHDWSLPIAGPGLDGGGCGGISHVFGFGPGVLVDRCEFSQANAGGQQSGTSVHIAGTVSNCVIHHTSSGILGSGIIRNNHIYSLSNPTDPLSHSNAIYTFYPSTIAGNVVHDTQSNAQVIYSSPNFTGASGYDLIYNNLVYNVAQPCITIDEEGPDSSQSGARVYNNTLVGAGGAGYCIRVAAKQRLGLLDARNNHLISDRNPFCYSNPGGFCGDVNSLTLQNNLLQTVAQATAAGYTLSNGYRPTDASRPTAGAGQDFSSVFSSDILGVARTVAWDIGAYEITTGGSTPAGSPGSFALNASTFAVNETAGTVNVVIRRAGGNVGAVGCNYATANGTAAAGSNFSATSGSLFWGIGDTSDRNLVIPILNVSTVGSKSFTLNLSNPTGGASLGSPSSATVTINGSGVAQTPPPTSQPGQPVGTFTNPSFESGSTGWIVTGNEGIVSAGLYTPSDGSKLVAFNWGQTTPNGVVSQTFTTIPGQTYGLTFDVGAIGSSASGEDAGHRAGFHPPS